MKLQRITDLIIPPDRVRREFPDHHTRELMESIRDEGLFHPLLVRADGLTLVAGERRIRALTMLRHATREYKFDGHLIPSEFVPTVTFNDADAEAVLSAELHENLRRLQLTWQEEVNALAALHRLRKAKNPGQTFEQTERELTDAEFVNGMAVSNAVTLAEHISDPEIAKAANKEEALKALEKKKTREHREAIAARFGGQGRASYGRAIQGDMRKILIPGAFEPFDCIIADPPYGVGADTFGNQKAEKHGYADDLAYSDECYGFIAQYLYALCKDSAHVYVFSDIRRFTALNDLFSRWGWRVFPFPLIWHRGVANGIVPWPNHGPRRTYEAIVYAIKGDRPTTGVFPDVLNVPHDSTIERAAHKPPALYEALIRRSCLAGDRVLDPCCGTGPIFEAARLTNTFAVGVELEAAAFAQSLSRLEEIHA